MNPRVLVSLPPASEKSDLVLNKLIFSPKREKSFGRNKKGCSFALPIEKGVATAAKFFESLEATARRSFMDLQIGKSSE